MSTDPVYNTKQTFLHIAKEYASLHAFGIRVLGTIRNCHSDWTWWLIGDRYASFLWLRARSLMHWRSKETTRLTTVSTLLSDERWYESSCIECYRERRYKLGQSKTSYCRSTPTFTGLYRIKKLNELYLLHAWNAVMHKVHHWSIACTSS